MPRRGTQQQSWWVKKGKKYLGKKSCLNIAIKTVYKSSTIVRDLLRTVAFLSLPPNLGRIQTHLKAIFGPALGAFSNDGTFFYEI